MPLAKAMCADLDALVAENTELRARLEAAEKAAINQATACAGATHRHKRRGTEYVLIGYGRMQAENWWERNPNPSQATFDKFDQMIDMREVAIYRSIDDGSLWVRPRDEFEDGRFEALGATSTSPGASPSAWDDLDAGIRHYVMVLRSHDVDTCQSCEGGPGHAYPEPTIDFHGSAAEGFRAVSVALTYGFPVASLRREWSVIDGEPTGPLWSMTFMEKADRWLQSREDHEKRARKEMGKLFDPRDARPETNGEVVRLLREVRDKGLIYWEPNTERGHERKADMLARIDAALAKTGRDDDAA